MWGNNWQLSKMFSPVTIPTSFAQDQVTENCKTLCKTADEMA